MISHAVGDPAQLGHKFARLQRMRADGLPVPELFCLPAAAFDDALAAVAPPPRPGDPAGWCADAAAALRRAAVPPQVLTAFDTVFGPDALVAVRACAVPAPGGHGGEDGADPFAGMSDSYLYVPRHDLLRRVADCWASAFTDRAVAYRLWRGLDPTATRIAVGVQRMVPGTRSFVAFTRDPRDSARRTVIAAAHGIGEGIVQEKADVDHFFVTGRRVTAEPVRKQRMVGPPRDGGDEPEVCEVPAALADAPVLADAEARHIAALAARVEQAFGGPQDIEGVITQDGAVHLVQARPLVTAAPEYWCNHNITESYPGVSSVLTYSQASEFYRRAFGDLYRRMGVPRRRFDAHRHHLEQLVAFLDGRIYYRLAAWHALHGQIPAFELVRPLWEDAMGVRGPARQSPRWSQTRAWLSLPPLLLRALRHPAQVRAFLRWWDGLTAAAGDLSDLTPPQLVEHYRRMWTEVSGRWGVTLTNSVYSMLAIRATTALLTRWTGADRRLLTGLLVGGRPNRSLRAVHAAVDLAERISAVPALKDALLAGDAAEPLWRDLTAGRHGQPVADAAADYVRRYGDRAMHDLKLEEPTPRQRPWTVLDLVRPYVQQGLTTARLREEQARATAQARADLARDCRGPLRRTVLRLLAATVRATIRAREDTRFCRTQLYGLSRQVMWRLGTELARAGRLADPADVRHLTVTEVLGSFDGTLPGTDLRGLVAVRRAEHDAWTAAPAREVLLATEPGIPLADALARSTPVLEPVADPAELRGLGSAPGVVRAPARLVLGPDTAAGSCQGTILVARETDPGWLFLMMSAKGLVVERGTLLSHTAITGRLLGIPTVVAVPGATSRIPDGAVIEIDGAAGTVRIVEGTP
ncbi:phosphoenolpyruvate synthase [Catellatospora sp. TT07R-123]|uniref:PEP/pyruvate-binding domain-containing protein n=1 Tax=Catellatospora sp. TT07R-123 TaxID=2733863 RepID=UPI001B2F62D9|nr:PEP/pyruvate-binding domain-containing protein [Catellatospora sp. TT07R-123]GHJ42823.1 phosphoenolpyruvate synthase [Catellatospora sp. TT07R-123]